MQDGAVKKNWWETVPIEEKKSSNWWDTVSIDEKKSNLSIVPSKSGVLNQDENVKGKGSSLNGDSAPVSQKPSQMTPQEFMAANKANNERLAKLRDEYGKDENDIGLQGMKMAEFTMPAIEKTAQQIEEAGTKVTSGFRQFFSPGAENQVMGVADMGLGLVSAAASPFTYEIEQLRSMSPNLASVAEAPFVGASKGYKATKAFIDKVLDKTLENGIPYLGIPGFTDPVVRKKILNLGLTDEAAKKFIEKGDEINETALQLLAAKVLHKGVTEFDKWSEAKSAKSKIAIEKPRTEKGTFQKAEPKPIEESTKEAEKPQTEAKVEIPKFENSEQAIRYADSIKDNPEAIKALEKEREIKRATVERATLDYKADQTDEKFAFAQQKAKEFQVVDEALNQTKTPGYYGATDISPKSETPQAEVKPVEQPIATEVTKQPEAQTETPQVKAEAKPVEEPIKSEPIPETPIEQKPAKAASDINKKIVEQGFDELPESVLARYDTISKKNEMGKVATLLENDLEKAKNMATGKEKVQNDIHPQVLFNAVKNKAVVDGDYKTLKELAQSPIATERSIAAQTLGASGFDNGTKGADPVRAIQDVIKSREESPNRKFNEEKSKQYEEKIKILEDKINQQNERISKIEAEKVIKKIKNDTEYQTRKEKRTYTKEQLHTERKDLYSQLYKATSGQISANPFVNTEAIKILGEITKNYVREGVTDVSQIVDAIYKEVKDKIEGITPRDIRDAISGYGKDTKKTRSELQDTIVDLKKQMQTISKIEDLESGKIPVKSEINKMRVSEELKRLKAELKTKLKESGITDQETLAKSKELIKKSIKEINDKIYKGDYTKKEKPQTPTDIEKVKLQKELKFVRDRYNEIQKHLGEKITDQEAKVIADYAKKTSEAKTKMEGAPRRKLGESATPEEIEYGRQRVAFAEYVQELKDSANKLTWEQFKAKPISTTLGGLKHIPGITKSAKATLDNSGLLNQHIKTLYTHPTIWSRNALKSFQDMVNTFRGHNVLAEMSADIVSRPNYENYIKDKLAIGVIEEAFPDSKLLEKIPILGSKFHKAADVAYTGLAYRNRADLYDLYTEIAKKSGHEETTGLGIGKMVNALTGRGDLGKLERAGDAMNVLLFAPRFVKSHWDVLTAHTLGKDISPFVRKQAAINLAKIIGSISAVTLTANAIRPGSVETDPRSSDFGKIKIGDTRFNFTGGMGALVTLGSRLLTLSSKSTTTGEVTPLNSNKFGAKTGFDVLLSFGEGKLSPVAGLARDVLKGQTFGGDRLTLGGELVNLIAPLPFTNISEMLNDPKSANVVIGEIADALGLFSNTYSNDPELQRVKGTLLRADDEKLSSKQKYNFRQSLRKAVKNNSVYPEQAKQYEETFNELQKEAEPKKKKVKKRLKGN